MTPGSGSAVAASSQARMRLRTRMVIGQMLVVVAALFVTWAVTAVIGPPLFQWVLADAGMLDAEVVTRAERAFQLANLIEVPVGVGVAFILAAAVSPLVTRRVAGVVARMSAAAARIAEGAHTVRVPASGVSRELDELAAAFNSMAWRLQRTERTRRRLLGDLAHEMRTPIATLKGYLQAIEDGVETADAATLAVLADQATRLGRLARDLHAVSAADEGGPGLHRTDVDLAELASRVSTALRPAFTARDVTLNLITDTPVPVRADPDRIGQVLTNLLGNALRHTPAGGVVTVTARAGGPGSDDAELEVADTGEGIAAEDLPYVVERFYRAHPPDRYRAPAASPTASAADEHLARGSGVGLTVSRSIVAAHGGRLTVHSDGPGQGSRALVQLPTARR